jgi:hypothetical protein
MCARPAAHLHEAGVQFRVYNHKDPQVVHATMPLEVSDTPARLKLGGFLAQNSENFMCYLCEAPFSSLATPRCFERHGAHFFPFNIARTEEQTTGYPMRDEKKQIRYKLLAKHSSSELQERIAAARGVRYAAVDSSSSWSPQLSNRSEFMHLGYLGTLSCMLRVLRLTLAT